MTERKDPSADPDPGSVSGRGKARKRTSPLAIVAFVLALLALGVALATFSRVYNLRGAVKKMQKQMQGREEEGQRRREARPIDLREIGHKIAQAKDSVLKGENRIRAAERLSEAREMMLAYKERVTPALKQRWEELVKQTETAAGLVKGKARDVGEELDKLAGSVERFFEDEKTQAEPIEDHVTPTPKAEEQPVRPD